MNSENITSKLFKNIEILPIEFLINSPENVKKGEKISIQFVINLNHKVDKEKKIIIVILTLQIIYLEKKELLKMVTHFIYKIDDLDKYITFINKNSVKINTNIANKINDEVLILMKGILFEKTRGTYLNKSYLADFSLKFRKSNKKPRM